MSSIRIIDPGGQFRKHFSSLLLSILGVSMDQSWCDYLPDCSRIDAVHVKSKSARQGSGFQSVCLLDKDGKLPTQSSLSSARRTMKEVSEDQHYEKSRPKLTLGGVGYLIVS
jgi:hypothetical protein